MWFAALYSQKKIIYDNRCLNNILFMSHAFAWISVILTAWFLSFFFFMPQTNLIKCSNESTKTFCSYKVHCRWNRKGTKNQYCYSVRSQRLLKHWIICFLRIYCPAAFVDIFQQERFMNVSYRVVLLSGYFSLCLHCKSQASRIILSNTMY